MQVDIAGQLIDIAGDPNDPYFQTAAHHAGAFANLRHALNELPDDAVLFDVGANIGLAALAMAHLKPRARIIAFEPGPSTATFLRQNAGAYPNIEVVAAAVSDKPGQLHFHVPDNSSGSHVVGTGHMAGAPSIPVPCITLDAFCAERGLSPDFMKIDVEGHEPEALAGATRTIERHRPLIHIEINSWTLIAFAGHQPAAFLAALFRSFDIESYASALELLHVNLLQHGCVTDIAMRLKAGAVMPTLAEMSYSPAARQEIEALQRQLSAV